MQDSVCVKLIMLITAAGCRIQQKSFFLLIIWLIRRFFFQWHFLCKNRQAILTYILINFVLFTAERDKNFLEEMREDIAMKGNNIFITFDFFLTYKTDKTETQYHTFFKNVCCFTLVKKKDSCN